MSNLLYQQRTVDGRLVRVYDVIERATNRHVGVVERPAARLWIARGRVTAQRFPERRLAGEWLLEQAR